MQIRRSWSRWPALLALVLVVAACTGDTDGSSTTVVDDCVADGTCSPGPEGAPVSNVNGYTVEGTYQGLSVGFTGDGYPFIGDPAAPVSIIEYSDYLCPFCFRHTTETTPSLLLRYGSTGDVNFVFSDFPLDGLHPTAPTGHSASLCVAEQSAALFWEYHDLLFRNQQQWASIPDPTDYLETSAETVGADMAAYRDCMDSGRTAATVTERVEAAFALGFSGTPSFQLVANGDGSSYDLVGAQPLDVFTAALDAMLAGETPPGAVPSAGSVSTEETAAPPKFTVDPDSQDIYNGYTVGFTEDGYPFIGEPDAAVTVLEYSDYLCPFCLRYTTQTAPTLFDQYAAGGGDVNFVFKDLPLVSLHPTAPRGHQAAQCAAEQGAAFFWAYHDSLFFNQDQWSGLADPTDYLEQTAENLGVDMDAYQECMDDGRTAAFVEAQVAEGLGLGFSGTPTFQFLSNESGDLYELVGAHPLETFQSYLDAMVAGEAPPDAVPSDDEPPELPFWAHEDGLMPDPARPGYTLAGDAYKGDPDAPLVVIEFSDFQCPSCQRHALEAQPLIDETFVVTGQIMWVFKHFPLSIHPQAPVAAAAAECAGDQNRFFEMESALFENVEEWSVDDPDPVLTRVASEVGLNTSDFATCLSGRKALERVLADLYDGGPIVSSTPTFIVVEGGQGAIFQGARDAEEFVELLQNQVDSALAAASGDEG